MSGPPIALVGATASGKSTLAMELARADRSIEIVSVDSMQVYRGMDIGTAKPTSEERAEVPHHLIDLLDPSQESTVAWFQRAAREALRDLGERGKRPLLVGGTGLYHRAVIDGLDIPGEFPDVRAALEADSDTSALYERLVAADPVAAERMEPGNRRRIVRALEVTIGSGRQFSSHGPGLATYPASEFRLVGIALPPETVRRRIEERYAQQLEAGFLDEVRQLRDRPAGISRTAGQALGYRELLAHLDGELGLDEALDLAVRRTRQFARRQRAWFRRDPRVHWIEVEEPAAALAELMTLAAGPAVG